MNPTFCKYILQRRQGQFWGSHFLILALNCNKVFVSFISRGSNSQIFGPKWLKLSRPFWTDFTIGAAKSRLFRNSYLYCLFGRINFLISSGAIPHFNILHATKRKFRLWIDTEPSFLAIREMWISYHYKLFVNIFHEFNLSCYFPTTMKHPN